LFKPIRADKQIRANNMQFVRLAVAPVCRGRLFPRRSNSDGEAAAPTREVATPKGGEKLDCIEFY
jgi:hypothetical protein